jgi:hypothetical protein
VIHAGSRSNGRNSENVLPSPGREVTAIQP